MTLDRVLPALFLPLESLGLIALLSCGDGAFFSGVPEGLLPSEEPASLFALVLGLGTCPWGGDGVKRAATESLMDLGWSRW